VKEGGVAVALAKMSFGNQLGCKVNYSEEPLAKSIGSMIVECKSLTDHPLFKRIGEVRDDQQLKINDQQFTINNLLKQFTSTFNQLFPTVEAKKEVVEIDTSLNNITPTNIIIKKHGITPKVFAPVFPGTNCEFETKNAFRKEGATVTSLPLVNISHQHLEESIALWVKEIGNSQILVLSGGFSAGDEPDGSAKFIVNVLKNERMKDAA